MTTTVERLEEEHDCWTDGYWLRHAEWFRVESDEECLGYVEEVVWAPDRVEPLALRVRTRDGESGVVIVMMEDVLDVRPRAERILSRRPPRRSPRSPGSASAVCPAAVRPS